MAHAICVDCGENVAWRATRGARLSDQSCPKCGGKLKSLTAGRQNNAKGKNYQKCAVCDKNRLRTRILAVDAHELYNKEIIYAAGAIVCGHHHLLAADHPYFALLSQPVSHALLLSWVMEYEEWLQRPAESLSDEEYVFSQSLPGIWRDEISKLPDSQDNHELIVMRNTILDYYVRYVKNWRMHERDPNIFTSQQSA